MRSSGTGSDSCSGPGWTSFGNLSDPKVSARLAFLVKPAENHSVTLSLNQAYRAPSFINNFLQTRIVSPVDLSGLAPLLPPPLQPDVARPFPLVVNAVGSNIPIGGMAQNELVEDSLTAYEVSYTGVFPRGTTLGGSLYVNRRDDAINFVPLPPGRDPYTAANPPPGWRLPPLLLAQMAQAGRFLPRTGFTYLNLGPIRQTGLELWLNQRFSWLLAASVNYSWQSERRCGAPCIGPNCRMRSAPPRICRSSSAPPRCSRLRRGAAGAVRVRGGVCRPTRRPSPRGLGPPPTHLAAGDSFLGAMGPIRPGAPGSLPSASRLLTTGGNNDSRPKCGCSANATSGPIRAPNTIWWICRPRRRYARWCGSPISDGPSSSSIRNSRTRLASTTSKAGRCPAGSATLS